MTYRFTLPVAPMSSQTAGKRICSRGGRIMFFKEGKVSRWQDAVRLFARQHAPTSPMEGPVGVRFVFVLARPKAFGRKSDPDGRVRCWRRPDDDNLQKPLRDSLDGFWLDDAQICQCQTEKWYAAKGEEPSIECEIYPLF